MSSEPEFGVMLSTFGDHAYPAAFRRVAATAEREGFDAVWAGDHVSFPAAIPDDYPFSRSGESPFHVGLDTYDVFGVLSHLAAVTDEIDLGTNTCIVPYRHPVVLARNALTLEQLSDGRFDFGVAPGWLRTEFEVLDVPFEERGSRTDEFLRLLDRVREEGEVSFDGPHHSFRTTGFHPVPESGRPKVWIGGKSGAAFRRVAEFGDGWTIFWDHPDDIAASRERILNAWRDYDRTGEPEIAVVRAVHVGADAERDTLLTGPADDVVADVEAYVDAGVTRVVLDFYTTDIDEQVEQVERFAREVTPSF
ncbi:TIGR03619 family F420-dependent LLM class oxidoreductase [Halomarina halobia]|uniref:TIGR03619 family F420-dependent LLM class oxidoreductase n=1 Tax=Halomarina halobia TaxID=3033386 RepID=A0ABD6AEM6_9EURY|nr:TIGR03619 family F420-dependent LLM class oxidoreductase [Halomarina sp. PSR21]